MALKTGATLVSRLPLIVAEMPDNVGDALRKGAELIAEEARNRAPVGIKGPRGEPTIKESILVRALDSAEIGQRQVAASKSGNDLGISSGLANQTTAFTVEAQARSPRRGVPYALMVEFGTEAGAQGPKIKQPFMVPAYFEKEQEVVDLVADELGAL